MNKRSKNARRSYKISLAIIALTLISFIDVVQNEPIRARLLQDNTTTPSAIVGDITIVKTVEKSFPNELTPQQFKAWDTQLPFPCVKESSPNTEGIFYIKLPKTSSTTLAKVTNRIAVRQAKRQNLGEITCKIHNPYTHQRATIIDIGGRDLSKSWLWSVVRNPTDREISHYGMRASRGERDTNDFINSFETHPPPRNIQLHFLAPEETPHGISDEEIAHHVQSILQNYNFIGIYEELDKSLVVLSMLLGVEINDVIYDFLPSRMTRCGSLEPPGWLTPEIKQFTTTDKWFQHNKADFILYDMVNKAFYNTIEMLGPDKVQAKLDQFQRLIRIGTTYAQEQMHMKGCGVPLLFPEIKPWNDIDELSWFSKLSIENQEFVKKSSPRSWENMN